jgi:4-hydroxybenzoyl-CoA reductase subunit beta
MLPLPSFELHTPRTIEEALTVLERHVPDARLIAGGTDVVPNMKLGLYGARHLVSLARVRELVGIRLEPDGLHLGAMTPLEVIARHPDVRAGALALAEAAAAVGGPHHRRMGTLGGNLCLDTRCRFYNQSHFWRAALGHCIKKDGSACHVVAGGKKCVAAASNDTAAAAIALDCVLVVAGPRGTRRIPAADFWTADGTANTVLTEGEIVLELRVPLVPSRRSAYEKLRRRSAIDFPLLSVAARVDTDGGAVTDLAIVVSALAARPRRIAKARALAVGVPLADLPLDAIAAAARAECNPLANVDADTEWRKEMVAVHVRRALVRALA